MPTETETREHPSHPESKRNDMSDDPYTDSGSSPPAVDSNPFPPLATDEYEALRESIYRFGVLVPVIVDLEGNVLDGQSPDSRSTRSPGTSYLRATRQARRSPLTCRTAPTVSRTSS